MCLQVCRSRAWSSWAATSTDCLRRLCLRLPDSRQALTRAPFWTRRKFQRRELIHYSTRILHSCLHPYSKNKTSFPKMTQKLQETWTSMTWALKSSRDLIWMASLLAWTSSLVWSMSAWDQLDRLLWMWLQTSPMLATEATPSCSQFRTPCSMVLFPPLAC